MSMVNTIKDTKGYVNFHNVYNQRWKNDAQNKSANYRTDNDIFNTKQSSQIITNDRNHYKHLAKELAEKSIDRKLRVIKIYILFMYYQSISPYLGGFRNQDFISTSLRSHNLNQEGNTGILYPSSYVKPNKKEIHTIKDILVATNYGGRKEAATERKSKNLHHKKEIKISNENNFLPCKLRPITPTKEQIPELDKEPDNKKEFKEDSLVLEKPLHGKKPSDVTTKHKLPNQMKSLIFYDESAKKINHRRTSSEGMSRKFNLYPNDPHYIGNDELKKKLQEANQSQKFYFYGEKRDALVESAKQKSEKKEKYVESLIEGYNFSSDFKKNVTHYLNRIDK